MARVKRGVTAHAKHKKVYKATKGHYGRRRNTIRIAKESMEKAQQYAYRDRKNKKRTFRALWIQRLNAAVREHGLAGPVEEWERMRDRTRAEIDARGVAPGGWFTQFYGSTEVDASLLLLVAVGFCAPDDPRRTTVVVDPTMTTVRMSAISGRASDSGATRMSCSGVETARAKMIRRSGPATACSRPRTDAN